MRISKKFLSTCLALLLLLGAARTLYQPSVLPKLEISMQQSTINIDDNVIKMIDLGLHRMISSILWSETLLRSDVDHYKSNDFENWMFLRVKTITSLDPYFYEAYLNGGVYLSIIKDDDLGAEYIYDKGLKYFPNDYYLNLNASFHYYFELGKINKSIEALKTIVKQKGSSSPRFVIELLAKLNSMNQDEKSAFALIFQLYQAAAPESLIQKRYSEILYSLRAQTDLRCLNSKDSLNCKLKDFFGTDYVKNVSGEWSAQRPWRPYRAKGSSTKN